MHLHPSEATSSTTKETSSLSTSNNMSIPSSSSSSSSKNNIVRVNSTSSSTTSLNPPTWFSSLKTKSPKSWFRSIFPHFPSFSGPHQVGVQDVEWEVPEGLQTDTNALTNETSSSLSFSSSSSSSSSYSSSPTSEPWKATLCHPTETLMVRIFYPTFLDTESDPEILLKYPRPFWLSEYEATGYTNVFKFGRYIFAPILSTALSMTKLPAFKYAPLLPSKLQDKLPVMVFSHGLRGCKGTYSYFCGDMASHGMIVVAIEHRDRSACVTLHKQQVRHYQQAPLSNLGPDDYVFRHAQILHRAKEVEWTHAFLKFIEQGEYTPLASWKHRIALKDWIMAGHSFGGATTLHILQHQKFPFSCGFVMDPWCFPIEGRPVKVPVATSNSSNFHWKENIASFSKICDTSLTNDIKYKFPVITIKDTAHTNHSDVPMFFPNLASKAQFAGTCDPHFALHLNNQFCLSFLRYTLPQLQLPPTSLKHNLFPTVSLEEFIFEKHPQVFYGFKEAR